MSVIVSCLDGDNKRLNRGEVLGIIRLLQGRLHVRHLAQSLITPVSCFLLPPEKVLFKRKQHADLAIRFFFFLSWVPGMPECCKLIMMAKSWSFIRPSSSILLRKRILLLYSFSPDGQVHLHLGTQQRPRGQK